MTARKTTSARKPKPGTAGPRSTGRLQQAIDETVKREIAAALRESDGNVTHAAAALGVSLRGLWKRLATLKIDPADFRK
jgi:transcriptional regulator with PAS, ATPase and Fis domain